MYKVLLIGVAGLIGTLARYWLSLWIDDWWNGPFPLGTIIVNLVGCFTIGFLFHAMVEKHVTDPILRSAVFIGFLGGFTTFSSFAIQSVNLFRDGRILLASANVLLSNVAGLMLAWMGYAISRAT
jgi:fluoride exporter